MNVQELISRFYKTQLARFRLTLGPSGPYMVVVLLAVVAPGYIDVGALVVRVLVAIAALASLVAIHNRAEKLLKSALPSAMVAFMFYIIRRDFKLESFSFSLAQ